MSVEAISWALNLAPVPVGRCGQPSSACKFVLVGLANHAGPDGTGAFPSVATLVRYTGLLERTVRTCLHRLEAAAIIRPCDPDIVATRIKRADRRPQGWHLNLTLVRDDLDPGRGSRLAASAQPDADGVQSPHPVANGGEAVDNRPDGVQQLHPAPGTGCNRRGNEVQQAPLRGAAAAPETYREPSGEPAAPAFAREAPSGAATVGGGPVGEFFAVLGADWRLTPAQRARLAPAVTAAIARGWTPRALAGFGANTNSIRNSYAVPASRLSPAELPPPHNQPSSRPPWCGECDRPPGCSASAPTGEPGAVTAMVE